MLPELGDLLGEDMTAEAVAAGLRGEERARVRLVHGFTDRFRDGLIWA
jgi:hypothetical protein